MRRRTLLASALATPLCHAQGRAATQPTVFVSILPQRGLLRRIAGESVRIEVLVPPGASPATHEPTAQQMLALDQALVWFRIGVPFEEVWAPRIAANHPRLRIVETQAGIERISRAGGRPDPHIWLSPRLLIRQSETMRNALAELIPTERARFSDGQARLAANLAALDRDIAARFASVRDRRFMIYHPALTYFARDYGLEQIPIEIEGGEPGPQTLARLIATAREANIRVVFVQREFPTASAEAVARAIGGEVVPIAPLAEDVLDTLTRIAEALLRALA